MKLQLQTWADVEKYLKRSTGIIVPIGSTEQHGPNGLIGTDALTAEIVGQGVGEAADALVTPTIAVGMAQHHLGFAGSMTLRPTTLIAVIRDMIESLAVHGFTRFFFVNGHGGNIATATAAFSEIYAATSLGSAGNRPSIKCALRNWWEAPGIKELQQELYGDQDGSHATASEISLTWFRYPEAARPMKMDPPVAPKGTFTDAADYRRNFPDGRIGSNPSLASAEHGKRFYEVAVKGLADDYRKFAASA
jgi:creatinine amidohydrolase